MKMNPKYRPVIWAALTALLLLFLTYEMMNLRWSVSGEKMTLKYYELARRALLGERKPVNMEDSVLLINVHYDKRMVMERDAETGREKGMIPVVDRSKLLRLLEHLNKHRDYRYIMIDVALDAEVAQPEDRALCKLLRQMPRVVAAMPSNKPIIDQTLLPKMGRAQYGTTIWENDFVKYPYMTEGMKSIPLKMYEELTGKNVIDHALWYSEGWSLVRSSVIQTFELRAGNEDNLYREYDGDATADIALTYNVPVNLGEVLGEDISNSIDEASDEERDSVLADYDDFARNRYVLIGDYDEDLHTIYSNDEMAGTVINFNAYLSMLHGHHRVSLLFLLILFGVYCGLCYLIFTDRGSSFKKLMTFDTPVLVVVCLMTYWLFDEVYDVFLSVVLLGGVSAVYNLVPKVKAWYVNRKPSVKPKTTNK